MLEKLINKFIHRPVAVAVTFASIFIAGIFAAFNMPLEIIPSLDYPKLYINTVWHGASSQAVEAYVTSLIEGEITTVRGVKNIKSFSYKGFSQVQVDLQPDADVDFTRFCIQEKISFLIDKLPGGTLPPRILKYIPEKLKTEKFMSYYLSGTQSDAYLRNLALKKICPVINSIPGVAGSEVIGGRERQVQILFDEKALQKDHLSVQSLYRALKAANYSLSVGQIIESGSKWQILLHQNISSLHELENLPLKFENQHWVLIRDVAVVKDTLSPPFSLQRINGKSTILIEIQREPQYNTIKVADRVYETIRQLQQTLPHGVQLIKEDDQNTMISRNIKELFSRAGFIFVTIFLILTFFLRRFRYAILIQSSILLTVLFTLLCLFLFRISLNMITLAGLALGFGILVDNSIIVLENMRRKFEKNEPLHTVCVKGAAEIFLPVAASTLTTIAALFPFLFLMEEVRIYYEPFAVTVSLALAASLPVAFLFVPTIHYSWLNKKERFIIPYNTAKKFKTLSVLEKIYTKLITSALKQPWLTLVLTILLFGIPFWKVPSSIDIPEDSGKIKKVFIQSYNALMGSVIMEKSRPYLDHLLSGSIYLFYRYVDRDEIWRWDDKTYIQVFFRLPSGTAIEETDQITQTLEKTISGQDGIRQIRTRVYPHYAYMEVFFTSSAEKSAIPFLAKEKLISRAVRIGNASISVSGYGTGFHSGGEEFSLQNRLLLTGYNYHDLVEFAAEIKKKLEAHPRVRDVQTELTRRYYRSDVFENNLRLNYDDIFGNNLTATEAVLQLQPFLSDYLYHQWLRVGWEEVPFSIKTREFSQFQLFQLNKLPLKNRSGQEIKLSSFSSIMQRPVSPVIERENQQYYSVIAFDYLAPFKYTRNFIENFLANISLPPGYAIKSMKTFWWGSEKKISITLILIFALIFMYMVLAGLYESFSYPFLIFLIIPLSLIGVFLIYYFTDTTFDQSAYIGVIFLFGIVINNAIIMLDRINRLKLSKRFSSFKELLIQAGLDRLRPILMTTFTTIGGLLPILLIGSKENVRDIWYTLSLSTVGGLLSATILGLVVLPVLVFLLEKGKINLCQMRQYLHTTHQLSKHKNTK